MAVFPWFLIHPMASNTARYSSLESEAFDICWTAAGESGQQSREFWDSYVQLKCQEACCTQSYLYNWKERGDELQTGACWWRVRRTGYVGGWGCSGGVVELCKSIKVPQGVLSTVSLHKIVHWGHKTWFCFSPPHVKHTAPLEGTTSVYLCCCVSIHVTTCCC